jgi:hypothetical protein
MPDARAFLLEEIGNVEECLKEALRHDYGAEQGIRFFAECNRRAAALRKAVNQAPNSTKLESLSTQVLDLATLVSRIERSHRGEFSWAFASKIRALGEFVCSDRSRSDPAANQNLFYFGSEGGLDAYAVCPEESAGEIAVARIFSVTFPRTLKHHVLLHPILGHELGHAARAVPSVDRRIDEVLDILIHDSPLDDVEEFKLWLQLFDTVEEAPDSWFEKIAKDWLIEFFCDLFGLLLFGPSYIGAHCTLLGAIHPTGANWDEEHPPVTCRTRLIRTAAKHLGWIKYCDELTKPYKLSSKDVWPDFANPNLDNTWANLIRDDLVCEAIDNLLSDHSDFGGAFYRGNDIARTPLLAEQALKRLPPSIPQQFDAEDLKLEAIDFRDILMAGWLAWTLSSQKAKVAAKDPLSFHHLNKLCDQAILQSMAISRQLGADE